MNRIIKFRAWDKEIKRMLFAFWVGSVDGEVWVADMPSSFVSPTVSKNKNCTLMQFTNLLDKNGRDIFESDIVNISANHNEKFWNEQVVWNEYFWSPFHRCDSTNIEVIGNIYENPELLQ